MKKSSMLASLPLLALSCLPATAQVPANYARIATIQVPPDSSNLAAGQPFNSFDIGYVDSAAHRYYVTDRNNAAVDVFNTLTNTFVTRIGGFTGIVPGFDQSAPNGVVRVGANELWASDGVVNGASRVQVINLNTNQIVATLSTGGVARADEIAYNPNNNQVMVINNADPTPFATIISTDPNNRQILHKITITDAMGNNLATDGLEQPVWDAADGKYYLSVPTVGNGATGAIARIDPVTFAVDLLPIDVNPAGLALGPNDHLLVGASNPGKSEIIDTLGNLIANIPQVSGSDEVWYNSGDNHYYLAARDNPTGPVLGIVDAGTNTWLQNVATDFNAHSVAADSVNNEIFVPLTPNAGDPSCVNGCIGVYAAVPEPGNIALLVGMASVGIAALRKRRK